MTLLSSINTNYNIDAISLNVINETKYVINDSYYLIICDYSLENLYCNLKKNGNVNVLYPILNKDRKYITKNDNKYYYIIEKLSKINSSNRKILEMIYDNMVIFHNTNKVEMQLEVKKIRQRMDEVFNYLDYKFTSIEMFVRYIETLPLDDYTKEILKRYHVILDIRKVMYDLQKKLVIDVKNKKEVFFTIIHNDIDLTNIGLKNGCFMFSEFKEPILGIFSNDVCKVYLNNSYYNNSQKDLILSYFSNFEDEFYYNYFCFFTLFILISSIKTYNNDYVSVNSFKKICDKISDFQKMFINK